MDESKIVEQINAFCKNTLIEHLGIEFISAVKGKISAKMPVDSRTIQPYNLLHGGASLALAESVASVGSSMLVDPETHGVVGLEVNGNHVGKATSGYVMATATLVHGGGRTHVWTVDIDDERGRKIMVGRVTMMVVEKKP